MINAKCVFDREVDLDSIEYKGFDVRSIQKGNHLIWVVELPGKLSVVSSDLSKVIRAIDNYHNPYRYEDAPTEVESEITQPISSSKDQ